jgi:hypothetical protein
VPALVSDTSGPSVTPAAAASWVAWSRASASAAGSALVSAASTAATIDALEVRSLGVTLALPRPEATSVRSGVVAGACALAAAARQPAMKAKSATTTTVRSASGVGSTTGPFTEWW